MFIMTWLSILKMGMSGGDSYGLFGLHHGFACGVGNGGPDPSGNAWLCCAVIAASIVAQTL